MIVVLLLMGASVLPTTPAYAESAALVVNSWSANMSTGQVSYSIAVSGGGCSGGAYCYLTLSGWYVSGTTQQMQTQLGQWGAPSPSVVNQTATASAVVLPEITDVRLQLTFAGQVLADSGFVHVHDPNGAQPQVSLSIAKWSQDHATGLAQWDTTISFSGLAGFGGPCVSYCTVFLEGVYVNGTTKREQVYLGQPQLQPGTWSGSVHLYSSTATTEPEITNLRAFVAAGSATTPVAAETWAAVDQPVWPQVLRLHANQWSVDPSTGAVSYSLQAFAFGLAAVGNVCTTSCSRQIYAASWSGGSTGSDLKSLTDGVYPSGTWSEDGSTFNGSNVVMPAGVNALHLHWGGNGVADLWISIADALAPPPAVTSYSLSLATTPATVKPSDNVALTATANQDVGLAGQAITIFDLQSKTALVTCSEGTTCSAALTAGSSPRYYQAVVGSGSSYAAYSNALSVPSGYDVPANMGMNPSTPDGADPVNLATGNFHDTISDLVFPASAGLPAFTRTYNSEDTNTGALGRGWSTSFQSSVQTDFLGNALLRTDDGKTLRFIPKNGGGFTSPPGYEGALTHQGDGTWQLSGYHGGTVTFDSTGRMTGMTNADGTTVTLSYTGAQLSTVTSSTGYTLTLSYDPASGLLTGVGSSDGRSVSYGYTGGQLTTATDVAAKISHYRYDAGGFLDQITDPDGRVQVTNIFDGTGRVTHQAMPLGQSWDFSYSDNASRSTTLTESNGAQTVYTFDADARLLGITDSTGSSLSRSYDSNGYLAGGTSRLQVPVTMVRDAAGDVTDRTVPGGTEHYVYDASNRLVSATDVLNHLTRYGYTGSDRIPSSITWPDGTQTTQVVTGGLVTSRTDADGVTTSFGYDSARNLTSVQVGTASATTMSYDSVGRMLTRTSPGGNTESWTYDSAGRVLTHTDAAGDLTQYGYDGAGHLTASIDANNHTTSYVYDDAGRLVETHAPDGTITSDAYDPRGQLLSEIRPGNAVTHYVYGPLGRVSSVTDPEGRVTSYGYDADGQVTGTTTADGLSSSSYDPAGELLSSSNPAHQATSYTRDALERVTAVTDPTGAVTRTSYDGMGRVSTSTDALSRITRYSYTPGGRLASITYPDGSQRSYGYNSLGQRISDTNPGHGITRTSYTPDGQVATVTSPGGLVTAYGYDPAGRTTTVSTPGHGTTTTSYTPTGQVATRTDATAGLVQYGYNAMDELTSATDPLGKITTYGYDVRGNRTSVTDPLNHTWTTTFNLDDEPTGTTDPLGHASSNSYDGMGRVLTSTDAAGVTSTNSYDPAGNLTRVTYGDGTHSDYTYDPAGRRLSAATADGTETFGYDAAGQLVSDSIGSRTVGYGYDLLGRVSSITYPDGSSTTRSYDSDGNLLTAAHTGGGQASYTYDADGHVLTATAGAGTGQRSRSYTWTAGLLTGYSESATAGGTSSTLGYDPAGRLTSQTASTGTTSYRYDPAGQLLAVAAPAGQRSEAYSYDPAGNLSSNTIGGTTTSYSYDAADQLTSSTSTGGATSFGYDPAGRLTGSTGPTTSSTLGYDGQGRLLTTSQTTAGTSTSWTRAYTPAGELASLTTTTRSQLVPGLPATVSSSTSGFTWDRTHAIPQPLVITTGGADSNLTRGPGDDLAYASTASTPTEVFSHNALGDLLPTTDTAGLVQGSSTFTAYGQPATPSSSVGLGYRGQLHTGSQIYLRNRTLDPTLGRFTTRDPLDGTPGQPVSTNPYPYTVNDPINQADSSGLNPSITDVTLVYSGTQTRPGPGSALGTAEGLSPAACAAAVAYANEYTAKACLSAELAAQGVIVGAAAGCAADVLIYGSLCGAGGDRTSSSQTPTQPQPGAKPTPTVVSQPPCQGNDSSCDLVPVWFGQRRISPNFGAGGAIGGSPSGVIRVFTDARTPGVYIAESNRTLASYSLAGAATAPACMMLSVPSNIRNRLKDDPLPPQTSLPSPVVPVTRSITDLTPVAPYEVASTVSVPRSLAPC